MLWPSKLTWRAGVSVALLLPPLIAIADLPPPTETIEIPQPKGIVEHQVEAPTPSRPVPPLPLNMLQAPAVPEQNVQYNNSYEPYLTRRDLPVTFPPVAKPISITLQDAILLALRYNPNVESSQLTRVDDKYNLYLVQRTFVPIYNLSGGSTFTSANRPVYNAAAGVNVLTPFGTQFGLNYATTFPAAIGSSFGAMTFSVAQPLLQGFGFVNKIPLLNAYDTEDIAKLTFKSSVIAAVTQVINAYRTLVSDYNNLDIQKSNLDNTRVTTEQYVLQLKAGKMAPSDLTQQKAQLAQAELTYEQQRNQVDQDYRSFLISLGLTVSANLKIDRKIDLGNFRIPSAKEAIKVALENNIAYQQALLQLRQTERSVISAQDARLPNLTVALAQTFRPFLATGTINPPVGAGLDTTSSSSVTVNLTVPIDNVQLKANYIAAKVAVIQSKLALSQTKENLVSTILNDLAQLHSLREQVTLSEQSVAFQKKTYENFVLKLRYGKSTVNEVTYNQTLYLNQALQLVGLEISYLNQITAFQSDMGTTLDAWNIKLRY